MMNRVGDTGARAGCSRLRLGLTAAAALSLSAGAAMAQNINSGVSIGPSTQLSTVPPPAAAQSFVPPLPQPEALLVDPYGLKSQLRNLGIVVEFDNINEFGGNVSGGLTHAATDAGQYGLEADVDWERLAGITGFATHTVFVGRYGANLSSIFGDNLNPVQEIYGAGGNVAVHLVYTYGEETFANGRMDIAFGRMPVLNDFDASPLNCNFMSNSLCGNPKGFTDNSAISSYPDASWGARLRARPVRDAYIQVGLYDVESGIYTDTYQRSGFKFDGADITGEVFPVELGYEPSFGPDKLTGHYKAGFAYSNSSVGDDYIDVNGAPYVLSGLAPKVRKGRTSAYVAVDQMLTRNGPGENQGITVLGGYVHNDPTTSQRAEFYYAGALDRGFLPSRPDDTAGLLFSYTEVSNYLASTQADEIQFGLPISGGATGVQRHEETLEVNYDIHVYRGVNFQPDFQYIFRPNAQNNINDALFIGFKSHIQIF